MVLVDQPAVPPFAGAVLVVLLYSKEGLSTMLLGQSQLVLMSVNAIVVSWQIDPVASAPE